MLRHRGPAFTPSIFPGPHASVREIVAAESVMSTVPVAVQIGIAGP
jgi:hypothetical protein